MQKGPDSVSDEELEKFLELYCVQAKQSVDYKIIERSVDFNLCRKEITSPKCVSKEFRNLLNYLWDPNLLYCKKQVFMRIFTSMKQDLFCMPEQQSDLEDILTYKPLALFALKNIQLFVSVGLFDLSLFIATKREILDLMSRCGSCTEEQRVGVMFIVNCLHRFLIVALQLQPPDDFVPFVKFSDLHKTSKNVVKFCSWVLTRSFRFKRIERLEVLKDIVEEEQITEWMILLCEIYRLNRRETKIGKSKRSMPEEGILLENVWKRICGKLHPFGMLCIVECVIDKVRHCKGEFTLCDLYLNNVDSCMDFVRNKCEELIEKFPRNVFIMGQISDYFLRYVKFMDFDVIFSGNLLMKALTLNPYNLKTTHRTAIFYRMSLGNMDTSFYWLERTLNLDPTQFHTLLDYTRTILGKWEPQKCVDFIEEHLSKESAQGWTLHETCEIKLYLSFAYFMNDEREKTLKLWEEIMNHGTLSFRVEFDRDMDFYNWPESKITTDKLRLWMQGEKNAIFEAEKKGEVIDPKRKALLCQLFAIILGAGKKNPSLESSAHIYRTDAYLLKNC